MIWYYAFTFDFYDGRVETFRVNANSLEQAWELALAAANKVGAKSITLRVAIGDVP